MSHILRHAMMKGAILKDYFLSDIGSVETSGNKSFRLSSSNQTLSQEGLESIFPGYPTFPRPHRWGLQETDLNSHRSGPTGK
jgi:hypothetical protein